MICFKCAYVDVTHSSTIVLYEYDHFLVWKYISEKKKVNVTLEKYDRRSSSIRPNKLKTLVSSWILIGMSH